MTLKEIRQEHGWTIEEAAFAYGLDSQTVVECEKDSKSNKWAMDIILGILSPDYEDIIL